MLFRSRHPAALIGLAFMEFIQPIPNWDDAFHGRPQARELFKAFRTPGTGEKLILEDNAFVERVLPAGMLRPLNEEEMAAYRAPFPTPESRKPTLTFPNELPIAGEPADVYAMSERDHAALRASTYPKLMFFGNPGALVSPAAAAALAADLHHCRLVDLGPGAHYLQEDHPVEIGYAIAAWLADIGATARVPAAPAEHFPKAAAGSSR